VTTTTTAQRERLTFSTQRVECPKCKASRGLAPIVDHAKPSGFDGARGYCHSCGTMLGVRGSDELPADVRADMLAKWYALSMNHELTLSNGLAACMAERFGADAVADHLRRWHVGTDGIGNAVYWYVNGDGYAVTAKTIPYDPSTGKRRKGTDSPIRWLERRTSDARGQFRHVDNFHGLCTGNDASGLPVVVSFSQKRGFGSPCLFGEFQLADDARRRDTVLLVEAEKTAVIASLFMPDVIVVATGGAGGLTPYKARPLVGRTVLVLMDNDPSGERGTMAAARVLEDVGAVAVVEVEGKPLAAYLMPDSPKGYDLADYYLQGGYDVPSWLKRDLEPAPTAPTIEFDHGDAWEPPADTEPAPPAATLETPQTDAAILSAILRAFAGEQTAEIKALQQQLITRGYAAAVYSLAESRGFVRTKYDFKRGAYYATLTGKGTR